jgi:hypothetical protein
MNTPITQRTNSFILRIWWEELGPDTENQRLWRGWVQHVRSGEAIYFQDVGKLLAFIEEWTGQLVHSDPDEPPARGS